jgi:polyhydroxybutyrate depolymerase
MLGTRLIALGIVCLPAAISVASCSERAPSTRRASAGSAPALLPNQGLGPSAPDGSAGDGSLITSQSTPSAPETISDVPPAASLVGDAGDPLTAADGGDGVTDAAGTDSNDDEDGVGESNSPTPITPSVGCAEQNPAPAQGLGSLMIRGLPAEYLVTLPDGYDGTTPLPLVFAFHGRARTYLDLAQIDATFIQTELGSRAIMVYPQAQGGEGWTNEAELPPSIEFWNELYGEALEEYCVDRSHVFAVGHSSGGFFSHILGCRYGERLRGIGVVAGTLPESDCSGYVAALMIHGVRDSVVATSRGESARDFLLTRNGCTPDTESGSDAHCVDYQGCEPGLPISWCEHDEPTYDDTNHGWPSFASHAIGEFLFSLP